MRAAAIRLVPEAAEDYLGLNGSVRLEVRAALAKLQVDPRGYGEPLGNRAGINLFGFYSIRAGRRIRIIYSVDDKGDVLVRVIGRRERFEAHRAAQGRIHAYFDAAREELVGLQELLSAAGDG